MSKEEKSHLTVAPYTAEAGGNQPHAEPEQLIEHQSTQDNYITMNSSLDHAEPLVPDKTQVNGIELPKKIVFKGSTYFQPVGAMIQDQSSPKYLVDRYIELVSLNMVFGDSGAGKSFITVDVCCNVALGRDWHGNKVMQRSVIYIAGEGHQGYKARCQAWATQNNVDLSHAPLWFSNTAINFSDEDAVEKLYLLIDSINSATSQPVGLIAIDTFARSTDIDENNGQAVGEIIRKLDLIKDKYQCAILLVHHTGHQDKHRARGSTVLKGALDAEFCITKQNDNTIQLKCTKMKETEVPEPMHFILNDVELPIQHEGKPVFKAAIVQVDKNNTDEPNTIHKHSLGKNQKLGLWAIGELLKAKDSVPFELQWVTIHEWRTKLLESDLNSPRFYEVKKGLLEAGYILMSDDEQQIRLAAQSYLN